MDNVLTVFLACEVCFEGWRDVAGVLGELSVCRLLRRGAWWVLTFNQHARPRESTMHMT